ncbi:unnamed protein product (macronuclear) [Paramecium tetraurelia]|uniref:Uncharacterized protein n=1 Tax=Paramecium tetraurelia TaxID=5888 RepID=A0C796_PARTE|nr:uncharacterized protein GSPATT00035793001 [Paramecium tetraurelia]CAK66663.1 unnamed protein product [Paramecium tetraurelia]|eukprot:XP_001434060.1 hypothetical protein (macronuclear) [Paramecium tetraurelia strain d4-2]
MIIEEFEKGLIKFQAINRRKKWQKMWIFQRILQVILFSQRKLLLQNQRYSFSVLIILSKKIYLQRQKPCKKQISVIQIIQNNLIVQIYLTKQNNLMNQIYGLSNFEFLEQNKNQQNQLIHRIITINNFQTKKIFKIFNQISQQKLRNDWVFEKDQGQLKIIDLKEEEVQKGIQFWWQIFLVNNIKITNQVKNMKIKFLTNYKNQIKFSKILQQILGDLRPVYISINDILKSESQTYKYFKRNRAYQQQ